MPLIRLISHWEHNPNHVDKLIFIDGLPEEWMFNHIDGKTYLKDPWQVDITNNIPLDIRMKFQSEPFSVWSRTMDELRPGATYSGPQRWIEDEHKIYGVRLDFQTRQGKEMWDQVAELLDRETPRNLRVPKPTPVGDKFMWKLAADDLPSVTLNGKEEPKIEPKVAEIIPPKQEPRPDQFACPDCHVVYDKQRALWMHRRKAHKSSEPLKAVAA